jgi:cell division protease FtsH
MSDELGPLAYGKKEEQIFLGREISQHRDYSEHTAQRIDEVVKQIILDAIGSTTTLLEDNLEILKAVAKELLDKETITLADMDRIIDNLKEGKDPGEPRPEAVADQPDPADQEEPQQKAAEQAEQDLAAPDTLEPEIADSKTDGDAEKQEPVEK